MGTDNLYWKRKKQNDFRRKEGTRGKPKDSILIVCEGKETEPNYFKSFKVKTVDVEAVGIGQNTVSLVRKAIELRDKSKANGKIHNQVWCVFDRDSFPAENFKDAFTLAKQNDLKIAYSNEAFELWYLLHFNYYDTAFSRNNYEDMLTKLIGKKYDKKDKKMYEKLENLGNKKSALEHANKLLSSYPDFNPEKNNPSTTVHHLVCELNKFM